MNTIIIWGSCSCMWRIIESARNFPVNRIDITFKFLYRTKRKKFYDTGYFAFGYTIVLPHFLSPNFTNKKLELCLWGSVGTIGTTRLYQVQVFSGTKEIYVEKKRFRCVLHYDLENRVVHFLQFRFCCNICSEKLFCNLFVETWK